MDWKERYLNKVIRGDCRPVLRGIPDGSVDCIITSPPYWGLRKYGGYIMQILWGNIDDFQISKKNKDRWWIRIRWRADEKGGIFSPNRNSWIGALGLEPTFQLYLDHLMQIMAECKRVLRDDGTMWVNIGDSYGGHQGKKSGWKDNKAVTDSPKHSNENTVAKSLVGIPERFAIRMTDDLGMIRRNTIIWYKRNCMPASVKDRFTVDFEPVYFFVKRGKYWFEQQIEPAMGYDGRKDIEYKGGVKDMAGGAHTRWHFKNLHDKGQTTHTMHENRAKGIEYMSPIRNRRCVWDIPTKPSSEPHFSVAIRQNKQFIMIELSQDYAERSWKRIKDELTQTRLYFEKCI